MNSKYRLLRLFAAPIARKKFVKAALFVLIVGKGLSFGSILYLWGLEMQGETATEAYWWGVKFSFVISSFYEISYLVLLFRRIDATGSLLLSNLAFFVGIPSLVVYFGKFYVESYIDPVHYAAQAALLLSLALFQDKPVSRSGYILENGRYRKPESGNDDAA